MPNSVQFFGEMKFFCNVVSRGGIAINCKKVEATSKWHHQRYVTEQIRSQQPQDQSNSFHDKLEAKSTIEQT